MMRSFPLAPLSCLILLSASGVACAGESYVAVGLPGVIVGYAQTVNAQLGLRADVGTSGTFDKNGQESGVNYKGKGKYARLALLADYHPFEGPFHLTFGVTFNDAELKLKSQFDGTTTLNINGQTITPDSSDYIHAKVAFPKVMPYVGLGWGHQERPAGLGFVADVGVSIGRSKLTTDTNIVGKTYGGYLVTQNDFDVKTQDLRDNVGKYKLLPHLALGLSYRY